MARRTVIKRVVNALRLQHRVILHLECGHNDSIPEMRFFADPKLVFEVGDEHVCPFCPDPPPEPERPENPLDAFHKASFGGEL